MQKPPKSKKNEKVQKRKISCVHPPWKEGLVIPLIPPCTPYNLCLKTPSQIPRQGVFFNWDPLKVLSVGIYLPADF